MSVILIVPRRFGDSRGWFSETFNKDRYTTYGIADDFVQDNQSLSRPVGVVRGLHFQKPPFAQAKLIRCLRGRILDVAVDLRKGSPTFGTAVSAELTADGGEQLYIPAGFAHGFVTLEPDTEIAYKVSALYAPEVDAGIKWDDPTLGIEWPLPADGPLVSEKDAVLPLLSEIETPFAYDGRPMSLIRA